MTKFKDEQFEPWPVPIRYNDKDNLFQNAKRFLGARPNSVIVSNQSIYSLEGGIWHLIEDNAFAAEIQTTNEPLLALDVADIFGVMSAIKLLCHTKAQPFTWIVKSPNAPNALDLIPFRSGLLDFKTKTLLEYDGKYFATGYPDFDYDPTAKCPRWEQALNEWFSDSSDCRVSMVDTLQEFFGYILTSDTSLHAILALLGAGRAGKSTIVEVMRGLCGTMHTKDRILADLAGPHGLQGLQDARVIVIPDASDANLSNRATALGRIKAISGGDPVSINPKNLKVFECRIPARLVMVANRHPKFLDDSGAMAMRELPIMFTRSFQGDEARDNHLSEKLLAELPGIANWALEGLTRLRARRRFTEGEALQSARANIENQQSHMAAFARECLKFTSGASVSKSDMYDAYEAWHAYARIRSSEVRNREEFKEDLYVSCARHRVRLAQRKVNGRNTGEQWRNVELNMRRLGQIRNFDAGISGNYE